MKRYYDPLGTQKTGRGWWPRPVTESTSRLGGVQRLLRETVDLLSSPLEDLTHLGQHVALNVPTEGAAVHRSAEIGKGPVDVRHLPTKEAGPKLRHPLEDVVDGRLVLGQMRPAGVGDLIDLLPAFLLARDRESEVDEHRERRIDGARARGVGPREAVFELLDDLVAVTRLLFQQLQNHVLEIALLEHAATASTARPVGAMVRPRTRIRPGRSRTSPSCHDGAANDR